MFIIKNRPPVGSMKIIQRSNYTSRRRPQLIKERREHNGYASGSVYLQRVCSPPDASSSLILRTQDKNYLFNCGEETCRILSDQRISAGEIDHVFLSQNNWGTLGGLSTLLCDIIRTYGKPPRIHGPATVFKPIRRLSLLTALGMTEAKAIQPNILDGSTVYDDKDVCVESIQIPSENQTEKAVFSFLCTLKALEGDVMTFKHRSGEEKRFNDRREVKFLGNHLVLFCNSMRDMEKRNVTYFNVIFFSAGHTAGILHE